MVKCALAALLSFVILWANPVQAQPDAIVVGQVVDQHGTDVEATRDYLIGAKVYFDYVNSQGGIHGMHIKQVVRDSGGDENETIAQTKDLVTKERADVLFGYVGEAAIQALEQTDVLETQKIAFVSPLTGMPQHGDKTVFASRVSYDIEVRKIANYFQTVSLNRVALLGFRPNLYAPIRETLQKEIAAAGARLVFEAQINSPAQATRAIETMRRAAPNVVIVIGDAVDVALYAKSVHDTGITVVGLSLADYRTVAQIAGKQDANGIVLSQVVPNPVSAGSSVAREHMAFMKKYLDEPPSNLTLEGFMAAKALVQTLALIRGPINRQSILAQLQSAPAQDVGGALVVYRDRRTTEVELTMLKGNGSLLY